MGLCKAYNGAFIGLALKAQAQSRATIPALVDLKHPRPALFVKQANMTTGTQQVNNAYAGTPSHSGIQSGAGNIQSEQNKLLEAEHGQLPGHQSAGHGKPS